MANRRVSLIILMVLLFYLPLSAVGNESSPTVEQFGDAFDEVVIADYTDALSEPRDLEFHPGRTNELWVPIVRQTASASSRTQGWKTRPHKTVGTLIATTSSKK